MWRFFFLKEIAAYTIAFILRRMNINPLYSKNYLTLI